MKPTVVHVIRSLGSDQSGRVLRRLVSHDDLREGGIQHIILSLAGQGVRRFSTKHPQAEVRCLKLTRLATLPGVIIRLAAILRRARPNVIMTWDHQANLAATIAAKIGRVDSRRLVWNLSCEKQDFAITSF
jgi:hypothetical protein